MTETLQDQDILGGGGGGGETDDASVAGAAESASSTLPLDIGECGDDE
jgi:hypothetical protein